MATRLDRADRDFDVRFGQLVSARRDTLGDVDDAVGKILAAVRDRGDEALVEYTERFDRITLTPNALGFAKAEIEQAIAHAEDAQLSALRHAAKRIEAYHARQMP